MNDFRYKKTRVTLDVDREAVRETTSVASLDTGLRGKVPPETFTSSEHTGTKRCRTRARQRPGPSASYAYLESAFLVKPFRGRFGGISGVNELRMLFRAFRSVKRQRPPGQKKRHIGSARLELRQRARRARPPGAREPRDAEEASAH
jgi:hypothetical protein